MAPHTASTTAGPEEAIATLDSVATQVLAMVQAKSHVPVQMDSSLNEIGIDSLAMAEVLFEIETRFQIRADESVLDLQNVGEVVQYVRDRLNHSSDQNSPPNNPR
jgi:acyl carrier protein